MNSYEFKFRILDLKLFYYIDQALLEYEFSKLCLVEIMGFYKFSS